MGNDVRRPSEDERLAYLRTKAAALPHQPGVYIMLDERDRVIYVGKSRCLHDRVSQYFHGWHDVKTTRMASRVFDFHFITCDTEMEALALENRLIKQHTPRYNIRLKDAKSYPYIKLNVGAPYPRLSMTRQRTEDGSLYFGPYSGTAAVFSIINTLEKTLGMPACKLQFPRDIGKERPCIYRQTGRCVGVCAGDVSEEEYAGITKRAVDILRGDTGRAIRETEERMAKCAEELRFEEAARLRDSIAAMRRLGEKQKTVGAPDFECDVVAVSAAENMQCAAVFYIRSGYITDTEHFLFGPDEILGAIPDADSATENASDTESPITSFIVSLYQGRTYIPREILLSFRLPAEECTALSTYLSAEAGRKVTLRTPERGDARQLCRMAEDDARRHGENEHRRESGDEKLLISLAQLLGLDTLPERIECYDISSYGNEYITAGMIVAQNAKLKKSDYRFFKIKCQSGQDDYAAMREAILRRVAHLADEGGSYAEMPDLILLDGGRGHVSVVRQALAEAGFRIPVFGMVKDEHHKTRTLCSDTGEISVAREQAVFRFVYGLQEEVHRFTVSRMDQQKRKTLRSSTLEKVPGIGPAKAKRLLAHFGTLGAVKDADLETLAAAPGISRTDAEHIISYFSAAHKPQ